MVSLKLKITEVKSVLNILIMGIFNNSEDVVVISYHFGNERKNPPWIH